MPSGTERQLVAAVAAKFIVDGLPSYGEALERACRQLQVASRHDLPGELEVEEAVLAHLRLFNAESHPAALRELRQAAVEVLRRLARYDVALCGPVLSGSATRHNDIDIDIVGADPKEFEHFLLDLRVAFETTPCGKGRNAPMRYDARFRGHGVAMTLFHDQAMRRKWRPEGSLRYRAAGLDALPPEFFAA